MLFEDKDFIAKIIRTYRIEKGLTQLQLAELTGLSEQHVSKLENSLYSPSTITLLKLVKVLNIDFKLLGLEEAEDTIREKLVKLIYTSSIKENELYYELIQKIKNTFAKSN